jgi:hypothetical protein
VTALSGRHYVDSVGLPPSLPMAHRQARQVYRRVTRRVGARGTVHASGRRQCGNRTGPTNHQPESTPTLNTASRHLVLHGSIVLLFGLLLGAPYARAIKRQAADHIVNSWRVAHLSLPIGATLMLAVAALLPGLAAPAMLTWTIVVALVISSYGFCVSTPLAAVTGERGLAAGGVGWGRLVYWGNMVGAVGSLVAAVALMGVAVLAL